jgi:hypothetical protein
MKQEDGESTMKDGIVVIFVFRRRLKDLNAMLTVSYIEMKSRQLWVKVKNEDGWLSREISSFRAERYLSL